MKLNNTQVKNAKAKDKSYKLSDGSGMYLFVTTKGQKYWRMDYRFNGKRKTLALGVYPTISLKQARTKRDEAKEQLANGHDPSREKKLDQIKRKQDLEDSFESIARHWHSKQKTAWTDNHSHKVLISLEKDVFPTIGHIAISEVTGLEVLSLLKSIEDRGAFDMAKRVKQRMSQVFNHAIALGKAPNNPTNGLEQQLTKIKKKNYSHLKEKEVPKFLQDLSHYDGHISTRLALELLIITFVRTKELRLAKKTEFDLDKALWRIPAENMKAGIEHLVPLSKQAIELLQELFVLSGESEYLLPSERTIRKPISENTLLYSLYRMGYKNRTTVHGFRATASTILNENGFKSDYIERQLAHGERDEVRAAYNHAEYLAERTHMMQWYADKIDSLRNADNVIVANFGA